MAGGDGPIDLEAGFETDRETARGDPDAGEGLEVAVVGAGAVGATAAYDLATGGADVTLYDRGPVAGGATGRAAGLCYDAFATEPNASLGSESIERFRRLSGEDTFAFVECPYVWLAREGDDRGAADLREGIARMQESGIVALEMDADALGERFPALATDDVAVAGVAGGAGYVDPGRYTACMAAAATGAGATLETNAPVAVRADPPRVLLEGEDPENAREVDAVLVAAGAHSAALLEAADAPIAMKPYRVQAATFAASVAEPMCYDATTGVYVRPHPDGVLAGDGVEPAAADPDEWDREADADFPPTVRSQAAHRFPGLDLEDEEATVDAWAGLCTATPDREPLVGELEDGLFVATGFHGQGFMRAPAVGQRIASEILGGDGVDAFDPTRFTGAESFDVVGGRPDGDRT